MISKNLSDLRADDNDVDEEFCELEAPYGALEPLDELLVTDELARQTASLLKGQPTPLAAEVSLQGLQRTLQDFETELLDMGSDRIIEILGKLGYAVEVLLNSDAE